MCAVLCQVHTLLAGDGLFIHAHAFRREGLDASLVSILATYGWKTLFVPSSEFISEHEAGTVPLLSSC